MGHQLSRITTRTGDGGTTGLANGLRVEKDSPRVLAMGAVDELNSCIGVVLAHRTLAEIRDCLHEATLLKRAPARAGAAVVRPASGPLTRAARRLSSPAGG